MQTLRSAGHAPVNGLEMYYEIHGSGTLPLVLIHGGGSTIESTFGAILPLFAAYAKVIAVELQAHGRTSDRDAPESFTQDADDVAGLLQYLNISKANILGFSNGGSTALQMAIRHPELVHKIVVIAGAYKREGLIPGFFDGMQHATIDHMPESLKEAFLNVTPDKDRLQTMFNKDKERMITFQDWPDDDLRAINVPALIMTADRDVVIPEHAVAMMRLIPGAQLIVLPGNHGALLGEAGSTPHGSKLPGITAILVQSFLDE